jgi:hypothetical protein
MKHLNEMRGWLCTIPSINMGGCAYAAYAMWRVAMAEGYDAHMMYLYDGDSDYQHYINHSFMKGESNNTASCFHAVRIDDLHMDCKIIIPVGVFSMKHDVSEELVIASLKEQQGWNPLFRRDIWVDVIETAVQQTLKHINDEKVNLYHSHFLTDALASADHKARKKIDSGRDMVRIIGGDLFPYNNE